MNISPPGKLQEPSITGNVGGGLTHELSAIIFLLKTFFELTHQTCL